MPALSGHTPPFSDAERRPRKPEPWLLIALCLCASAMAAVFGPLPEGHARQPIVIPYDATVVLDPGHGGHDIGARGPGGAFEKGVTLDLARRIAARVSARYRVVLTRTDDYRLDLAGRTSAANHAGADLLLSLHTGGSYLHGATGMSVFYYENPGILKQAPEKPAAASEKSETVDEWDTVQMQHLAASRHLAEIIQIHLAAQTDTPEIRLQGAPLELLAGADMPAVIVEIGYLTNPFDEKKLQDPQRLDMLAAAIAAGINEFLEKLP